VHRLLCRTHAELVGLSLDDVAGEADPVNVPGVGAEQYSSWTRRLTMSLPELRSSPEVARVASCEERRTTR
jgi:4-alpha-glucanotransferase